MRQRSDKRTTYKNALALVCQEEFNLEPMYITFLENTQHVVPAYDIVIRQETLDTSLFL